MTREQVIVGVTLRVIATRWDRPVGTIATVTDMGVLFVGDTWWFTVEWLTHLPKRGTHSLRMFEEDLLTFELVTEPIGIPVLMIPRKHTEARRQVPAQTFLPFTKDDDDE